ncbi:hypothetical protein PED39_05275 [Methanomassiliicoccales archaeon LGM-RCC1]|nr:hypothetical protein PED39_05275 [Methanomassiliicoccales archaeon LGM-RCC1]
MKGRCWLCQELITDQMSWLLLDNNTTLVHSSCYDRMRLKHSTTKVME